MHYNREKCSFAFSISVFSALMYNQPSLLSFRNPGEDTKMLVCDMCDKGYHTFCLLPAIDSLPTNGWRCKVGKTLCYVHNNILLVYKCEHNPQIAP